MLYKYKTTIFQAISSQKVRTPPQALKQNIVDSRAAYTSKLQDAAPLNVFMNLTYIQSSAADLKILVVQLGY